MRIRFQIIFSFFIFNCIVFRVFAQNKGDYNWVMGYYSSSIDTVYGNMIFNFNNDNLKIIKKNLQTDFTFSSTSISNEVHQLQFFTGGCRIRDKEGNIMKNGDTLSYSIIYRGDCSGNSENYYRLNQGELILKSLQDSNQYFLFHFLMDLIPDGSNAYPYELRMTTVDMSKQNGKGEVIEKGKIILSDTFNNGYLSACRHANGRDWWIMATELGNKVYTFLLTNSGLKGPFIQTLNEPLIHSRVGGSSFATDGGKYAIVDTEFGLDIFDFDRCTGILSNRLHDNLSTIVTKNNYFSNLSFSPNSKLLYLNIDDKLYQYDCTESDILKSVILIDTLEDYKDPFKVYFKYQQLAPDGKIYLSTGNGSKVLHVIDNPDVKGAGCNFKQHAINLPKYNSSVSYYPNYRLGPLKGSPCDTILGVANKDITIDDYDIKLFPNPANDQIKIDITLKEYDPTIKTEVVFVDVSGAIVQKYTMPDFAYLATIDISKLASGVYGVQLRQPKKFGERVLAVEKLVVVR